MALFVFFWLIIWRGEKHGNKVLHPPKKNTLTQYNETVGSSKKTRHKNTVVSPKSKVITTYNEDPVIDKWLIYSKYQYCFDILSPKTVNSTLRFSNPFNKTSQEKKKIRLKEYRNICEKLEQQHPEFSFKKKFSSNNLNIENTTTSVGERLFGFYSGNSDSYSLHEKISDIKSVGVDLLLSGNYLLYNDFQQVFQWDLENLLRSNNVDYVRTIYNYAQDLYACRQGAECGKYSTVILTKCIMNDAFCVDDFEELVNSKLTSGQQADLLIVYNYLQEKFDE